MSTVETRGGRRNRAPISSLSVDHVRAVLSSRASETPVSTEDVTDLCQAAYPNVAGITVVAVSNWLRYMAQPGRRQVECIPGSQTGRLRELGVEEPRSRINYWLYRPPIPHARDEHRST